MKFIVTFLISALCTFALYAETAEKIINVQKGIHSKKSTYYSDKEQWDGDRVNIQNRIDDLKRSIAEREIYLENLRKANAKLVGEYERRSKQIATGKDIEQSIGIILTGHLSELKEYVNKHAGYTYENRIESIDKVLQDMASMEIKPGDKIRRVMELYMVEADLGRFPEVYEERIVVDEEEVSGYFLRLGSLAQFFVTPDASMSAVYDPQMKAFRRLPEKMNAEIIKSVSIVDKRGMPEIISLPVGKIEK